MSNTNEINKMELLDMNDDCLEHVLLFLDLKSLCCISDSCKDLNRISEAIFKKHCHYKCYIGDEEHIKKASKIIRKIGQYVNALQLEFDPIDPDVYKENGIGCRFLSFLNHMLGEKFRELELTGEIWNFAVLRLAPTFLKLEKLSIYCEFSEDDTDEKEYVTVSMDLPQLCPNLRVLTIENCALIFAPNTIKSFRNLEVLEFYSFGAYYPIDLFECFIRQNKQIRRLYVDYLIDGMGDTYVDLAVVANLKDLKELRIRTGVFENWVHAIRDFSDLHHLTTLVMSEYMDDIGQMNDILDILKTMTQLKKLWIGWSCPDDIPNQQAIANIAKELKQLESFQVDLKCDSNTIIECIRFGHSLERFCVALGGNEVVTSTFIRYLAQVLESVADAHHQPLLLYFHGAKLNGDVLKVLKEPSVARYLSWKFLNDVGNDLFERCNT